MHTFTDKSAIGGAVGGAVGALIAGSTQAKPRDPSEFGNGDPDLLASEKKSIVVEHASVAQWELRKQMLDDVNNLLIEYQREGKRRKLKATIIGAAEVTERPAWSGARRKETCLRHAQAVEGAYARALPPELRVRFRGIA